MRSTASVPETRCAAPVPLALGLLVAGCGAGQFNVSGAAERLKCPTDQVRVVEAGDADTKLAEGCGRSEMYTRMNGATWMPMQDLKKRASFDLGCAPDELALTPMSTGRQQGVAGCGKKAVYSSVQTTASRYASNYDWVMDSGPK